MLTIEESARCSRLLRSLNVTSPVTATQLFEMASAFTAKADAEVNEERRNFLQWKSSCALDAAALLERSDAGSTDSGSQNLNSYDWTTEVLNEDIAFIVMLADRMERLNHAKSAGHLREISMRMRNTAKFMENYS